MLFCFSLGGLNGSPSPITVILSSDSAIPAQWLRGIIRSYKEADDVFTESFLRHVFIISNASISNSTINLFIRDALSSWGADLAVIQADEVDTLPGPYYAAVSSSAFRPYRDTQEDSIFGTIPAHGTAMISDILTLFVETSQLKFF